MKLSMQIAFTYILISLARKTSIGGNANKLFGTISSYLYGQHGTQVTIQTPNYPKNYPNNAKCTWFMIIPAKTKIKIKCEAFNVLQGDFFNIRGFNEKFSGNSLKSQTIIFEKKDKLFMEFTSDSQKTSTGFNCTVCLILILQKSKKKKDCEVDMKRNKTDFTVL